MQLFFAEVFMGGTALNQQLRYSWEPVICGFFEMKSFAGGSQCTKPLRGSGVTRRN
jgi:hypothetical protein